uniref:Uncharacterized protein n=1 Tax=Plectus sambesii TaxID=2011161 RepID=A0A914XR05_9BILA
MKVKIFANPRLIRSLILSTAFDLLIAEGSQVKRPRLHAHGHERDDGPGDVEDPKCADELADWLSAQLGDSLVAHQPLDGHS